MTSECPVCLAEKRLVVTTCKSQHSFCEDCLKTLVRQHGPSFPCPVCRQTVSIPSGRVSRLPSHRPAPAAGEGPAATVGMAPDEDPGEVRDTRRGQRRFHLHFLRNPHGAMYGHGVLSPLSPSSTQRNRGGRDTRPRLPPFLFIPGRPVQRGGDLSEDSEVDRAGHLGTQTGTFWPRNPVQPLAGSRSFAASGAAAAAAAADADNTNAGRSGPSAVRGPSSGSPLSQLSEDEQMAFALQAAEFQPTGSFRSRAGPFGTFPFHGRPVENEASSPPDPSLPSPSPPLPQPSRHRLPFSSRAGSSWRDGQASSLSLAAADSDEGLALRLQEEEIRRASARAREQRLARGALDEDDLLALRLQEEEIRAAKRQGKDRQAAQLVQQRYQQGLTDTQGLVHGLQRIGFFSNTPAGPASVERREEVTGPGEPDPEDSSPNSPPPPGDQHFFDASENEGLSDPECFEDTDHAINSARSFLDTSELDGLSELGCYAAEHAADTGERTVYDHGEHEAASERTLIDRSRFMSGEPAFLRANDQTVPEERVSFRVGRLASNGERTLPYSGRGSDRHENSHCAGPEVRMGSTFLRSGELDAEPGGRSDVCSTAGQKRADEGTACDSRLPVSPEVEESRGLKPKKKKKKKFNRRGGRGGGGSGGDGGSAGEGLPGYARGDP